MAVQVGQFGIEACQLKQRRGRKPVDGAQQNAGASAVHLDGSGRMGLRLDLVFDGADEDGVFDYGDDNATGGEVHDDFLGGHILNLLGGGRRRRESETDDCAKQKYRRGVSVAAANDAQKPTHSSTVPQVPTRQENLALSPMLYCHGRGPRHIRTARDCKAVLYHQEAGSWRACPFQQIAPKFGMPSATTREFE